MPHIGKEIYKQMSMILCHDMNNVEHIEKLLLEQEGSASAWKGGAWVRTLKYKIKHQMSTNSKFKVEYHMDQREKQRNVKVYGVPNLLSQPSPHYTFVLNAIISSHLTVNSIKSGCSSHYLVVSTELGLNVFLNEWFPKILYSLSKYGVEKGELSSFLFFMLLSNNQVCNTKRST